MMFGNMPDASSSVTWVGLMLQEQRLPDDALFWASCAMRQQSLALQATAVGCNTGSETMHKRSASEPVYALLPIIPQRTNAMPLKYLWSY